MKKNNREFQFNTEYSNETLKKSAVKGGVSSVASQAIKLLMQTAATAVLARILFPEDFGLIAMVTAISNFALLFKDLGLSTSVIQRQHITYQEANAIFWLNCGISAVLTILSLMLAPLIAYLYDEPRVTALMSVVALTFLISGMGSLHYALARRQLNFWIISINEVMSMFVGILVAIAFAYYGARYWALLAQIFTQVLVSTLLIWFGVKFSPSKPVWSREVLDMLKFGGNITLYNSLIYASRNLDNVIVGMVTGASALGFYSKAYNLLMMPMRQINGPLVTVALPTLSKLQDKPAEFKQFYIHATGLASFITVPLVVYSFVDADILVKILLGDRWLAVIETFRLLAPATFVSAVHFLPGVLCVATGRSSTQLKWAMYSTPVFVLGYWVGAHLDGINGVALSFSITYPLAYVCFLRLAVSESPLKMSDILNVLAMPFLAAFVAGVALFIFEYQWPMQLPLLVKPVMNSLLFSMFYLGVLSVFPQGREHLKRLRKLKRHA